MIKFSNLIKGIFTMFISLSCLSSHAKVETTDYTFIGPNGEQVAAKLGSFKVPENRSKNTGKELELSFVKFPAKNKSKLPPIVYLAGGPGGSATGTAKRQRFKLFLKMSEIADVILFDQRGTGLSKHYKDCKISPPDIATPTTKKTLMAREIENIKTCVKDWQQQGLDFNAFTTKENAADLLDLTKALGVEKVNLWGISYGSHLAFATTKYHPEIINKMVLASIEGLDHTVKQPARVQSLLEQIDKMLKQNPDTAGKYPNFLKDLTSIVDALETQPQIAEITDRRTKKKLKVGIGKIDFQFALSFIYLRDPNYLAQLPKAVKEMKAGDFSRVASYISYIKQYDSSKSPMAVIMDVASGISEHRWNKVLEQEKKSLVGRTTNFPYPDINKYVPVKDLGSEFRQEVYSDIPTLFFAGTLDGRTLYQSQLELTNNFSNKSVISIEGAGHNLYMSHPDVSKHMLNFYQDKPITSQTIKLPPLKFH